MQNLFVKCFLCILPLIAQATTWHIDPINGSTTGSGSAASPWQTLEDVINQHLINSQCYDILPYSSTNSQLIEQYPNAPIHAGDTILLHTGNHGSIDIRCLNLTATITVKAADGAQPTLTRLQVKSSKNWQFSGLKIADLRPANTAKYHLVSFIDDNYYGPNSNISLLNSTVQSTDDASSWDANTWVNNAADGILLKGENLSVSGVTIKNTAFSIEIMANNSLVFDNWINHFSGDAIRVIGNYNKVIKNKIHNCYIVDANHDDGIQAWSIGDDGLSGTGINYGNWLIGNEIIQQTQSLSLPCNLQGIAMFNGRYQDWIIAYNHIVVNHWHGIGIKGADNMAIIGNRIQPMQNASQGPPWIEVKPWNGTDSTNIFLRYNLVTDYHMLNGNTPVNFIQPNCQYNQNQGIDSCDLIYGNSNEFE